MASTIKIKNSSTAGAIPTSSDLVQGELAVNVTDKTIFTENASGTVVELGKNYTGFKNRIINGAMMVDQRNAGASVSTASGAAAYTLDRFKIDYSQTSKFTVEQTITGVAAPAGFSDYLGVTSSSAYSVLAGDYFILSQAIEGFNTSDLSFGTASAATVTLSFWVRSSLTGSFGGALQNSAVNRSYPFSYTISAANTWEQKTITIAGDTSGTWIGATNGIGLTVNFNLGMGSTRSGTAGAWAAGNFLAPTGATSVVGTSGATFYITGVQLEKGSTATSFDYRPYGTELALCQRYFTLGQLGVGSGITGFVESSTSFIGYYYLPVEMRSTPTLTTTGTAGNYQVRYAGGNAQACSVVPVITNPSTNMARITATVASGLTGGQAAALTSSTGTNITLGFNSEL